MTLDSPPVAGEPPRMRRRAILTFACASLMLGCAHHPGASPQDAVAPTEGWSLTVVNHHWLDVSVTLIADGLRSRLGTVGATRTETYALPARTITSSQVIRLEANPIGSNGKLTSDALTIQAGQHVEWTLETSLERSSVAIW